MDRPPGAAHGISYPGGMSQVRNEDAYQAATSKITNAVVLLRDALEDTGPEVVSGDDLDRLVGEARRYLEYLVVSYPYGQ